jgi:DNA-binding beta-propeller fold protein YncE
MSPLVLALGAGTAAYFLFFKKKGPPVAPTGAATDPVTKTTFVAQHIDNGMVDVFTMQGARIVRFDPATKREIISPPGVDPTIKAAAIRAFGILPKA